MTDMASDWQFYHAPGSGSTVEVYLRGPNHPGAAAEPLSLRGPFCDLTRMLPAAFRFEPLSPGHWYATVIDPCFWTPLLPAYYRLEIGTADGGAGLTMMVALRRLQVRGAHLLLDGRRWVFRGAQADPTTLSQVDAWHELLLGTLVREPDERLLEAASRRGVPVMIELDETTAAARLRSAGRWPAVQLALLPATASTAAEELASLAPNLLRIAHLGRGQTSVPDWAHAVLWEVDDLEEAEAILPTEMSRRPLFVAEPRALQWSAAQWSATAVRSPAAVRRDCQQFQQRLGSRWDISGYLV